MGEFTQALVLTTPHEISDRARDAQWLLEGHNRFKGLATYKDGTVDGDWGELSDQATARAKWWLGYPDASCTGAFGQILYEYLNPEIARPLPADYQDRRKARLAAKTPGQKAIALARTQIGTKESPFGSNCQPYGVWYRFNCVAWCAIFDSWCLAHSGYTAFRYAAVEQIVRDARAFRNHLRVVYTPMEGDLACYSLHGNPYAHVAFFDTWISQAKGTFYDIGGNTGPTDISNGGEVLRQKRDKATVNCFVRVG